MVPALEAFATEHPPFDKARCWFFPILSSSLSEPRRPPAQIHVTDVQTQRCLSGSTHTADVELHKSLVDEARKTRNKAPETGDANLRRYIVESINGAIAIQISQGKNVSRLKKLSMGRNREYQHATRA